MSLAEGETVCAPSVVQAPGVDPATHVCCVSANGRILTFPLAELKVQEKGGRGLMLLSLDDKDSLGGAAAYTRSVRLAGTGRGGKPREETLEIRSLNNAAAARGRKGKDGSFGFKVQSVQRVDRAAQGAANGAQSI
jgi:topoisomerase-4 subunit A